MSVDYLSARSWMGHQVYGLGFWYNVVDEVLINFSSRKSREQN